MSYADDVFIKMCQDILENGTSTEGEKVRPVWGGWNSGIYDQEIRSGKTEYGASIDVTATYV